MSRKTLEIVRAKFSDTSRVYCIELDLHTIGRSLDGLIEVFNNEEFAEALDPYRSEIVKLYGRMAELVQAMAPEVKDE